MSLEVKNFELYPADLSQVTLGTNFSFCKVGRVSLTYLTGVL